MRPYSWTTAYQIKQWFTSTILCWKSYFQFKPKWKQKDRTAILTVITDTTVISTYLWPRLKYLFSSSFNIHQLCHYKRLYNNIRKIILPQAQTKPNQKLNNKKKNNEILSFPKIRNWNQDNIYFDWNYFWRLFGERLAHSKSVIQHFCFWNKDFEVNWSLVFSAILLARILGKNLTKNLWSQKIFFFYSNWYF